MYIYIYIYEYYVHFVHLLAPLCRFNFRVKVVDFGLEKFDPRIVPLGEILALLKPKKANESE